MADLSIVLWAVIPPLLLLVYYYCRISTAPSLLRLLLFFIFGAVSGLLALSLEWVFETQLNSFGYWRRIGRSLVGIVLRQVLEIGAIEEGCKLATVIVPVWYLERKYRLRPTTVFLFTIAVAMGFTAEENCIYLFNDTGLIVDRLIGTPVHAMFSAPWGYALAILVCANIRLQRYKELLLYSWFNSVFCHALVNILSNLSRFPVPLRFLSYGLFGFLLWMFWRMQQLLRKVEGKQSVTLISGYTPLQRYWQRGLLVFALMLGGDSLFRLFLLAKRLSPLSFSQLFDTEILRFILSRLLQNLIFALVAWQIYHYLRQQARRRRYL